MGESWMTRLREWWSRGVNVIVRKDSAHRGYTHADRYSKAARAKRKARRKMASASRRRNWHRR